MLFRSGQSTLLLQSRTLWRCLGPEVSPLESRWTARHVPIHLRHLARSPYAQDVDVHERLPRHCVLNASGAASRGLETPTEARLPTFVFCLSFFRFHPRLSLSPIFQSQRGHTYIDTPTTPTSHHNDGQERITSVVDRIWRARACVGLENGAKSAPR